MASSKIKSVLQSLALKALHSRTPFPSSLLSHCQALHTLPTDQIRPFIGPHHQKGPWVLPHPCLFSLHSPFLVYWASSMSWGCGDKAAWLSSFLEPLRQQKLYVPKDWSFYLRHFSMYLAVSNAQCVLAPATVLTVLQLSEGSSIAASCAPSKCDFYSSGFEKKISNFLEIHVR